MVTKPEIVSQRQGGGIIADGEDTEVTMYQVLLDGEWHRPYASEFRAAMEYIRYMGFEQDMREALDAIGAGEVQVPAYRNI